MSNSADPESEERSQPSAGRFAFRVSAVWVIGAAVALLLLISQLIVSSKFFSVGSLTSLTPIVGVMVIVATGQAFVIGTGGIDLSVPATVTLMGAIILKQAAGQNEALAGAIVFCLVACVIIGLINGVLVEALRLNSLVATLAVGQLVTGYTLVYRGNVVAVGHVPNNLAKLAGADVGGVSYILIISVGIAILATFFLHRVVPGRRLVASSATERAAALSGLRARPYRIFAYVIAAFAYGTGGILASGQIGIPGLTLGEPYLLTSVVAVVLGGAALVGGRVSPIATLLGAVFITVLTFDLEVAGLSEGGRLIAQGVVLVLGLAFIFVLRNLRAARRASSSSLRRVAADGPQVTNQ